MFERLARVLHNDAGISDLKPVQWEGLRFFAHANRFSRTPSGLTAYLGITKGTVSQTINALERKGLIKKKKGTGDRRSISVAVTDRGQRLLNNDPLTQFSQSLTHLTGREMRILSSALESILVKALDQRSGRPIGVCITCQYFEQDVPEGAPHRCGLLGVPLSVIDSYLICREHEN